MTVLVIPTDVDIDPNVPSMTFSASKLGTWMDCSLRAKFQYEDHLDRPTGAAAVFGTVIHDTMEYINNAHKQTLTDEQSEKVYERALQRFKDNWAHPENITDSIQVWPNHPNFSYGNLRKVGIGIIKDFQDRNKYDLRDVIATEYKFCVPFGRHKLMGYVDLLDLKRNAKGVPLVRVVDYKTSSKEPTKLELALNIQLTIYHYAALQQEFWTGMPDDVRYPGLPDGAVMFKELENVERRAIWYALRKQKEKDAGPRTMEDFQRLYRVVEEVAKAQHYRIYAPKIGEPCVWCDYKADCTLDIPEVPVEFDDDAAWLEL